MSPFWRICLITARLLQSHRCVAESLIGIRENTRKLLSVSTPLYILYSSCYSPSGCWFWLLMHVHPSRHHWTFHRIRDDELWFSISPSIPFHCHIMLWWPDPERKPMWRTCWYHTAFLPNTSARPRSSWYRTEMHFPHRERRSWREHTWKEERACKENIQFPPVALLNIKRNLKCSVTHFLVPWVMLKHSITLLLLSGWQ